MAFRPGVPFRRNDGTWATWTEVDGRQPGTVRHTDGKYYKLTSTDENGVPTGDEGPTSEGGTPSIPAPAPQPNPSRPVDTTPVSGTSAADSSLATPGDTSGATPVWRERHYGDGLETPGDSTNTGYTPHDSTLHLDPTGLPGMPGSTPDTLSPPGDNTLPLPPGNPVGATTSPITAPAGNAGQQQMIYQNSIQDGTNPVAGNPWRPPGPGPVPYQPQQPGGGQVYPGGGSPTNTGMPPQSGQPGGPTTDFWSRDWQTPVQGTADMGGPGQAPLGNIQNTTGGPAIAYGGQQQQPGGGRVYPGGGSPTNTGMPPQSGQPYQTFPNPQQPTVGQPYQTFPNPQQPQQPQKPKQPRQLQGGLQSVLGYRQPGPFRRG